MEISMIVIRRSDGSESSQIIDLKGMSYKHRRLILKKVMAETDFTKYEVLEVGEARVVS